MKNIYFLFALIPFLGCSTLSPKTEDLQQSPTCTVWKDGPMGTKTVVQVDGELAKQKRSCWIMNTFGCSYTEYTFRPNTSEILSSLPPADKTIGQLNGDQLSVSMTGVTVPPFQLKADHADYTLQGPIGPKQKMTVAYNQACTKRQAALGLMTVIAK